MGGEWLKSAHNDVLSQTSSGSSRATTTRIPTACDRWSADPHASPNLAAVGWAIQGYSLEYAFGFQTVIFLCVQNTVQLCLWYQCLHKRKDDGLETVLIGLCGEGDKQSYRADHHAIVAPPGLVLCARCACAVQRAARARVGPQSAHPTARHQPASTWGVH